VVEASISNMLRNPERLAALHRIRMLDTPAEEAFDRLTRLAMKVLDASVGMVNFVDATRQFFKSLASAVQVDDSSREVPVDWGFCPFAMALTQPLRIQDARKNPVFANNMVVHGYGMVAYLGVPLTDSDGHTLGTICVLDHCPRAWTKEEAEILTTLGASVMSEVRLRMELERGRQLAALAEHAAQREQWRVMQLHAFVEMSLLIHSAASLDDTLQLITDQARGLLAAHQAAIVLAVDEDWRRAVRHVSTSPKYAHGRSADAVMGRSWLYALVREKNQLVRLTKAELDVHPARPEPTTSISDVPSPGCWLGAPLVARNGENLGVLEVSDRYEGDFIAEDEFIMLQLARLASLAIENTRLHSS